MNTLKITNLSKTYANGIRSLNNICLEITNGMFGLLGPNGAGKSSLMRTIAALQLPDEGSIEFNDIDIIKEPLQLRKYLGYLPQEFGVYPKISAYRLLDHLAVLKGIIHKKERETQILSLLEQTNLIDHRNKAVHTFSGGMRQRFGIAQALLGDPKIIIVDEPTAGLDPEERHRFNNLLSEIGEQVIVILSTHIVQDVKDLCTNMAIISNGSLLSAGKPSKFIHALEGNVWVKTIDKTMLDEYKKSMHVLTSRLNERKLSIRVLSDHQPGEGFVPGTPDLEDVYFSSLTSQHSKHFDHA
ncbi:MAG: yxlF 1 [Bacteroidota bacterium]|nr:yxlF 1 [Bacteroidota bacterium]